MSTLKTSIIAQVKAAATLVKPVVYSTPESSLAEGTVTRRFSPFLKTLTSVSSPGFTRRCFVKASAMAPAFLTMSSFSSLPRMTHPSPPTDPVASALSTPFKSTATVRLTVETIFLMAEFVTGLIASIGTFESTCLPESSYRSILSGYFNINPQ